MTFESSAPARAHCKRLRNRGWRATAFVLRRRFARCPRIPQAVSAPTCAAFWVAAKTWTTCRASSAVRAATAPRCMTSSCRRRSATRTVSSRHGRCGWGRFCRTCRGASFLACSFASFVCPCGTAVPSESTCDCVTAGCQQLLSLLGVRTSMDDLRVSTARAGRRKTHAFCSAHANLRSGPDHLLSKPPAGLW